MPSSQRYEMLVKPYLPELRKYCRYLSSSVWDGDDLYQETLFKTYRYYVQKGDLQDARPFMLKVARNAWVDDYRKRGRKKADLLHQATVSPAPDYFEVRCWIEWLAVRMSERHMAVWLLSDYFGNTMNEIANGLRITVSAVRSVLFRARSSLRACLRGKAAANKATANLIDRWVGCIVYDNPALLFHHAASSL